MSFLKYRKPSYRSGTYWSARSRDRDAMHQVRVNDREEFLHHVPRLLMAIFDQLEQDPSELTYQSPWSLLNFVFRSSGVDPDTMMPREQPKTGLPVCSGTLIWHAANSLRTDLLEYCLKVGANPSVPSEYDGSTAIHQAVITGAELMLPKQTSEKVLSKTASMREKAWEDYLEFLDRLLSAGVDINETDQRGWTPLMYLCSGVRPMTDNSHKCTYLHDSISRHFTKELRRLEVLHNLLRRGAQVDRLSATGESAVSLAAKSGQSAVFKILCAEQPDAVRKLAHLRDMDGLFPVHHAARSRSVSLLHKLLEFVPNGHVLDSQGLPAASHIIRNLDDTCRFARSEELRLLGAFPHRGFSFRDQTVIFHDAVRSQDTAVLAAVLEGGYEIDVSSPTSHRILLECCASNNHVDIFEDLLMSAQWPSDLLCDAWLMYVAMTDPTYSFLALRRRSRDTVESRWENAVRHGVKTHAFPQRATPHSNAKEVKKRLTMFGRPCVERKTWDELLTLFGPKQKHETSETGGFKYGCERIYQLFCNRLACVYRNLGFNSSLFVSTCRRMSMWALDKRSRCEIRRFAFRLRDPAQVDKVPTEFTQNELVELDCVYASQVEADIGLSINFTSFDTKYLGKAVDEFFAEALGYVEYVGYHECVTEMREVDFCLLARWSVHVMQCLPIDHPLQTTILERVSALLIEMSVYSQVDDEHIQYANSPLCLTFSPALASRRRLPHLPRFRKYARRVHVYLIEFCAELADAYRKGHRRGLSTVLHYFATERRSESGNEEWEEFVNLQMRLPAFEAFAIGGFDMHLRNAAGVTVIGHFLDGHTTQLNANIPRIHDMWKLWPLIFDLWQSYGLGVHWDTPFSFKETLLQHAKHHVQKGTRFVSQPGSRPLPTVLPLQCLAARAITKLPGCPCTSLPPPMQKFVELHQVPNRTSTIPLATPAIESNHDRDLDREASPRFRRSEVWVR
ncbi:uncharacterized protein LOC135806013 [Sycon ciliatum]|uniref:uncharacterized protein LOC135806013 n=1 Tax=Sycon ciliatum TaxID=27933 RepID=UPI0020AA7DAE|eukprot:scpid27555/ scgid26156/ 